MIPRYLATATLSPFVMPGLDPPAGPKPPPRCERRGFRILVAARTTWVTGTNPVMTMRIQSAHSIRHGHGAQRLALARREFFGLRLQLPAGGEDIAAARRAHRRGIAGIEDIFGEPFNLVPVRTFIGRARPGVERNEVDLGGNALEQLHQELGIVERIGYALEHDIFEGDAPRVRRTGIVARGLQQ